MSNGTLLTVLLSQVNNNGQLDQFDRRVVVQQIRSLQILETVNLMAGGLPHRMRFRAFIARYRILASFKKLRRTEDKLIEDCKVPASPAFAFVNFSRFTFILSSLFNSFYL